MIPVNSTENVPYYDEIDDITYYLAPMVGANEYETQLILAPLRNKTDVERDRVAETMDITNTIFDKFVKGWKSGSKALPVFPEDGKPSKLFKMKDKNKMVFDVILVASTRVSAEEKKS